jgi:hypothetical protein
MAKQDWGKFVHLHLRVEGLAGSQLEGLAVSEPVIWSDGAMFVDSGLASNAKRG